MSAWWTLGPLLLFLIFQALLNWRFIENSRSHHPDLWQDLGKPAVAKTLLLHPKSLEKYVIHKGYKDLPQERDHTFARRYEVPFRVVNIGEWASIALVVIDLLFF
ncbi:hypothetical protein [Marinimicrobium agarilyticum]|uniref:hypothetical protein n=1 Tax=Marinimicrobium agarilyticum TaxID=306546 RepID=UPI0004126B6E|nr:hypothetical protein [Marinimicrobium agarilyticum]